MHKGLLYIITHPSQYRCHLSAAGGISQTEQKRARQRNSLAGRVDHADLIGAVGVEEGVVRDVEQDEDAGRDGAHEAEHDHRPPAGPVCPLGQQTSDYETADDLSRAANYPMET